MGISVVREMVLLSTLAALVILVHSHEEEMESYRELGPQGQHTNNIDQSWRAVRSEPIAQTEDWAENSPEAEEAPRRRRPGRKRKRRPLTAITSEPEERRFYHEEPSHAQGPEYPPGFESPDMPQRRRRKRPEIRNNNWAGQPPEQERPMRRRGQRRKRPNRPEQAEPEAFLPDEKLVDTEDRPFKEEKAASFINHKYEENDETFRKPNHRPNSEEVVYDLNAEVGNKEVFVETERPVQVRLPEIVEEKSISDISKEIEEIRTGPGPIKPKTLKDILKKSNGSSLSEILQQHNLSLSDLLHGKENAISLLKTDDVGGKPKKQDDKEQLAELKLPVELESDNERIESQKNTELTHTQRNETIAISNEEVKVESDRTKLRAPELLHVNEDKPKMIHRRRYSPGGRRKLRLKTPMRNGTIKFPGNREYLSANARRLLHQSNFATLRLNASIAASEVNTLSTIYENTIATVETTTAAIYPEETTTHEIIEDTINQGKATTVTEPTLTTTTNDQTDETKTITQDSTTIVEKQTETVEPPTTTIFVTTTEIVVATPTIKPKQLNTSEVRRQALTNRLKKKRLKQKTSQASTTEASVDNLTKDLYGMSNLVSSSDFITKVQTPKSSKPHFDLETTLEDFMATEATSTSRRTSHYPSSRTTAASKATSPVLTSTTEEIAKIEIEEILNDTDTGARLSKILIERNMTIDELVEHRERGSSNTHLADIFHNTSREPYHGEPFLSKSSIEPISRETYPLRALLEANSHELKTTTMEPYFAETRYPNPNIPVVMDFGNNVNENGENLGIVSLFHKMAGDIEHKVESKHLNKDSEGTPYISTIVSVNITNLNDSKTREGRHFQDKNEMVTLNDIISMMHMNHNTTETKETTRGLTLPTTTRTTLQDADGVMVIENFQNLQDSNVAPESEENVDLNLLRKLNTATVEPGVLDNIPSHTKSVTVATASILGLSMVVFLLTYVMFKWKQQRSILRKKDSFCEDKIPSPVFETRKGTKNQSSTRSISPIISSTNIYTMSTLDSRNGKESPEYMWDSLRKPFQ